MTALRGARLVLAFPSLVGLAACSGEPLTTALEEPFRASDAQFREGKLPGAPPLTNEDVRAGVEPKEPLVSSIALQNALIPPREPARSFSGLASRGSVAVGVRFEDLGTGYWLLPTGNSDAVNGDALEWRFRAAFAGGLPPGPHRLLFAALDGKGRAGTQTSITLCLASDIPDNNSACDPDQTPPALVVSLGWEAPLDLDLRVVTPSGKVVDSKRPSTAVKDDKGKLDLSAPGVGVIDGDAFASCIATGRNRENLVFQSTPEPGNYLVYANLYDACGQPGAAFDISVHTAVANEADGTLRQKETLHQSGQLQAAHANGGGALGLFVTAFTIR